MFLLFDIRVLLTGLHHAADHAKGERSQEITRVLFQSAWDAVCTVGGLKSSH